MIYVTHVTESFPVGLLSLTEMAGEIFLQPEVLLSYATTGHCPHYRIDNGPPCFKKSEVKSWAAKNLIKKCEGKDFPSKIVILSAEKSINILEAPPELRLLKDLRKCPDIVDISGVYFLCKNGEIVYVGQSISIFTRISAHRSNNLIDFDSVFFIPVPQQHLNDVEGTLIRHFKPKHNGINKNGKYSAPTVSTAKENSILALIQTEPEKEGA